VIEKRKSEKRNKLNRGPLKEHPVDMAFPHAIPSANCLQKWFHKIDKMGFFTLLIIL